MSVQTLEQRRAKAAFTVVRAVRDEADRLRAEDPNEKNGEEKAEKFRKEFGREAKKLPVRILTSGLGQAICFLEAKGKAPQLRDALTNWIAERFPPEKAEKTLVERIREDDSRFLQVATTESLAYMQWLVRFAEAEGLVGEED